MLPCSFNIAHQKEPSRQLFTLRVRKYKKYNPSGGEKRYYCDQCTAVLKSRQALKMHMRRVHDKVKIRLFNCDLCDSTFWEVGNLRRHIKKTSDDRKYPCGICEKQFCFEIAANKHKTNEHAESTEPCDECDKIFYSKQNLNRHKNVIHLLKQYSCDQCEKVVSYTQALNEHMKLKHTDKNYSK